MNSFHNLLNSKYNNETNESKKRNISKIVPTYSLKNNEVSRECDNLKISINKNISDINEETMKNLKKYENTLIINDVSNFVNAPNKYSIAATYKTNLNYALMKNNHYNNKLNNSYSVSIKYKNNNCNCNIQKVKLRNTNENEKSFLKKKQIISKDYFTKLHNVKSQIRNDNLLYYNKINNMLYRNNDECKKENNISNIYVKSHSIRLNSINENLNNYKFMQKMKTEKSLTNICKKNKEMNSVSEMNINSSLNKRNENEIIGIPLNKSIYNKKDINFNNNNDTTNKIKHPYNFMNNVTLIKDMYQNEHVLNKKSDEYSKNENKNYVMKMNSNKIFNDHNLDNLKNSGKKYNSMNYFSKNNNEGKITNVNALNIDNDKNLVQEQIKNHDYVVNTNKCKSPDTYLKDNIKSEPYISQLMNINQTKYINNYSNMCLSHNNKYFTDSIKNGATNGSNTSHHFSNSRDNYIKYSYKDSDHYNNICNKCNNHCDKISYSEKNSDEKRSYNTFKKYDIQNLNNLCDKINMKETYKNCSNNHILKVLNKGESINKHDDISLYRLNEEERKKKINSKCSGREYENNDNKKMNERKPCSGIILDKRKKGKEYELLNQNKYFYKEQGKEENYKIINNKENIENVRHNQSYIENGDLFQNLSKNCYVDSNNVYNLKNKSNYYYSINHSKLNKETYNIQSCNETSKIDESHILNNAKNKNCNYNINIHNNTIYCKKNNINNKYNYCENNFDKKEKEFINYCNHDNIGDYKTDKVYFNEINKINTQNNNYIKGKNDSNICDYIINNSEWYENKSDKKIVPHGINSKMSNKNYKDHIKNYHSDKISIIDTYDNDKNNEKDDMLNKISKGINKDTNNVIQTHNTLYYEEYKRDNIINNSNNYYKKSIKDINLANCSKNNFITLGFNEDFKNINDINPYDKKVKGNLFNKGREGDHLLKIMKRKISRNTKDEKYSKENSYTEKCDHYKQNLEKHLNIHKTINQEKKQKEEEKEENNNNLKGENEKSGKKMNTYLNDVVSNDINIFIEKKKNNFKESNEKKKYIDTLEKNNLNGEILVVEKGETLVKKKKNYTKILLKDNEHIINESRNEIKNKIDSDVHFINKKKSDDYCNIYDKKINVTDRIKKCSYKIIKENNKQKHILISNPNYFLKNSKNNNIYKRSNDINSCNNKFLTKKNNTTVNCKNKLNSNNIFYNKKDRWKSASNGSITDEYEITHTGALTDSYIYHLNNINKISKQKNKKSKLKNYKMNEDDILYLRKNENNDLKKIYTIKESDKTSENYRKEDKIKYSNCNENINADNSNKIKEKRSKSVLSNENCKHLFNNKLIMSNSNKTKIINDNDFNIENETFLKGTNFDNNKNEMNSEFNNKSRNKMNVNSNGNMEKNKENNSPTEKNTIKKDNFLESSPMKNIPNNSINNNKNNVGINVRNINFDNIKNSIESYTTINCTDNCQNSLLSNNEKVDNLYIKTDDTKENKDILPWNKDNIVKLNIKNNSKKKKIITINTKLARYERVLIHTCINKLNWKKCTDNLNKGIFFWIGYNINDFDHYNYMKKKKIINRIPSIYMYTKKKALTFLLSHLSVIYPSLYDFYPNTFVLPENKNIIKYILNNNNKDFYIMKPDNGSMGIGVKLIHKYNDINVNILNGYNCYIIQKYIDNPLLMYKKKFDFRIYILLLPGKNYPKIYLSKIGFARLCTEEYKKKKRYICNSFVHLTNYSINKDNEKYIRKKNIHDKNNNKQLLSDVFIYLKNNGYDIDDIWKQIKKISCLTSLAIYSYIKSKIKYNFKNNFYFYQLIGLDILLDNTGKAWLLEVNSNPSLRIDYLDPNYTYFEIQLESMFDRYVKEPVISEMFLIVYKKIYKKYLKKKNKNSICINNKNEKSEKQNIKSDNKIKSSKIVLQDKPINCSFTLNNIQSKIFVENKKYPEDENIFMKKRNSYSVVDCNKINKTNSYILNKDLNKNKICVNNIKKSFSSMVHKSGRNEINICGNNSLTKSQGSNIGINNLIKKKKNNKKSLLLKKENMSNIDTCVDENDIDIDSFSSSSNIDTDKNKIDEHIFHESCNTNNDTYEKNVVLKNKKCDIFLNDQLNFLKNKKEIDEQKQEKNGEVIEKEEIIVDKDTLKFNNTSKEKKKNCLGNSEKFHKSIVNNNSRKKNFRKNYNNSDYSDESCNSNMKFVRSNFVNCFDDIYDNSIDDNDKNISLNFLNMGICPNNIDNNEITNSESNTYNNSLKNKDLLIESNILNKETYVQIGNQEDIQFDKFLNNDVETYKSIYRNISDNLYKKKIENLIMIRSNLYKYMNCLNVLGIRYINKDIENLNDLYNKNVTFDLKKTYTKIRKDILHPLKNNVLEKNVYINLKKETRNFYDEMKIYNICYFLFDFILKKYDNNLKKKNNKFEYYIDKNTFLCMCKDIKINKIIENIEVPTNIYNKFYEINKNSHENHMHHIIKEVFKNKNHYKKENEKEKNIIPDVNCSNNFNFLNNNDSSNISDEHNYNDKKKKKEERKSYIFQRKPLKKVDSTNNNENINENNKNNHILNKDIGNNSSYYSTVFCPFSFGSTNNLVNFNSIGINKVNYKRKKKMNVYDLEYLFTRQVSFSKYINKNQGLTLIDFFLLMQQLALLIFPYINYLSIYNSIYPYNSIIFEELNNQENNIFATISNDKGMNNLKKNSRNIKKIEKDQDNDNKGKKENKCNMNKLKKDVKETQEKKRDQLGARFNSEEIRKIEFKSSTNKHEEKKKDNYLWHKNICNNIYNLYEYIQISVNPNVKNVCLETFLTFIFNKYGISYYS
ncbi:tubulin--tyrosine ligase, putative [Plasmodium gallinaceum]|uniref:Tubulin--tyrosine ligase, putative n=1 Tax=Plasmodium gallinaceum TaxID=5849 RepID=A0A1J1GVF2_PLAGA|nr:tubulin--tyrosine ligase, putative [Plasmodium gallinaceum]CRG96521.1 tubulin--tyrosine ligase, putative [Plasmodium gallinaceum]